jgi:hypothetical protein
MLPLGRDAHARIYPLERTRGPTRSSARVRARMQFTHARNARARVHARTRSSARAAARGRSAPSGQPAGN